MSQEPMGISQHESVPIFRVKTGGTWGPEKEEKRQACIHGSFVGDR